MNAIRILLKDHEEVGKLFNQYVLAGEEAYQQKKTVADRLIEAITNHARLEDEILFPALEEKGGEDGEDMALEAMEEREIFPKAKKVLSGDLEKMGKEMEALKKQMKK